MLKVALKIVLISFIGGLLVNFLPPVADAESTVHRKDQQHEVELYVTSWWPYCDKAKSYLASKGIAFKVYDIEKDAAAAKRKKQLDPGRGVPFAIINGTKLSGWSQRMYELALED